MATSKANEPIPNRFIETDPRMFTITKWEDLTSEVKMQVNPERAQAELDSAGN